MNLFIILFTICLIVFSKSNLEAAKNGLLLWANNVVPSLFPFLIAVSLLQYTNLIYYLSKYMKKIIKLLFNVPSSAVFPFIMGLLSGYPVGAKIVSDMYDKKYFSKEQAEQILAYTNNSGPLFIIGTVGLSFFNNSKVGYLLYLTHILSAISVGIYFGFKTRFKNFNFMIRKKFFSYIFNIKNLFYKFNTNADCISNKNYNQNKKLQGNYIKGSDNNFYNEYVIEKQSENSIKNISSILTESIISSIKTILLIGGFVTLFSVIISILQSTKILLIISQILENILNKDSNLINSFLQGTIEITNGIKNISALDINDLKIKVLASSFILGFGGISVLLQVVGITSKKNLSCRKYFIGKILQGFFATFYTYLFYNLFI